MAVFPGVPPLASCCIFRHFRKMAALLCLLSVLCAWQCSCDPPERWSWAQARSIPFPLSQLLDVRHKDESHGVMGVVPKPSRANTGLSPTQGNHCFLPAWSLSLLQIMCQGFCEPGMTGAGLLCKITPFLPNLLQALSPGFTDFQMLLNYQSHDSLCILY